MIDREDAVLLVVDVQGKLARAMHERDLLFRNLQKLIRGMQVLEVPILLTEQVPDKLGKTLAEIRDLIPDNRAIEKVSFSCCGCQEFLSELRKTNRTRVILAGIEAHVCIYQTAVDLLEAGYSVDLIVDAVSSRAEHNKLVAVERLRSAGVQISSVEMVLFELQRTATGERFRRMVQLVK